jgi:endonuclease/exonuclease/phosphatase family metal-dependent hydrolase
MKTLTVVTANLDFAIGPNAVKEDLERLTENADVLCFQEAKNVSVDHLITDPKWQVYQELDTDAKAGSGLAWRKPAISGRGRKQSVGTEPRGLALLTRYITSATLNIDGKRLVVASVHLPPKRFWGIYPFMVAALYTFVKNQRHPVLIGGDWNKLVNRADDLEKFAKRVGGKFHGVGIDGFLLVDKGKWKFISVHEQSPTHSDHRPVTIKISPTK